MQPRTYTASDHTDEAKRDVLALVKQADTIEWNGGGNYDRFVLIFEDGAALEVSAHYQSGVYPILKAAASRA